MGVSAIELPENPRKKEFCFIVVHSDRFSVYEAASVLHHSLSSVAIPNLDIFIKISALKT